MADFRENVRELVEAAKSLEKCAATFSPLVYLHMPDCHAFVLRVVHLSEAAKKVAWAKEIREEKKT